MIQQTNIGYISSSWNKTFNNKMIFSPAASLPSPVKACNQDSDASSPVREEPPVVAEPSRPRPSTVTVIHTGTKWRQVPREVSWETTELWDGMKPSQASWINVVAQFAHPAASHLFLPFREEFEERLSSIYHGSALPTVLQTWKYSTERERLRVSPHQKILLWKPCSAWIVVVWQTNAAVSGKCHTKGNSLLKLL